MVLVVASDRLAWVYVSTALAGFGVGLVFACLSAVIVAVVPLQQTGVATGMNANLRTLGGAVGTAVMTGIVASSAGPGSQDPTEAGYRIGFGVLAGVFAVAAAVALRLPRFRAP